MNSDYYEFIGATVRAAGDELIRRRKVGFEVRSKADRSLVTDADLASEQVLIERIKSRFPDDIVFAEESGRSAEMRHAGSSVWVIDPLDGTTNYANGYPFYCVSVGRGRFRSDGTIEMLMGAVFDPERQQLYYAEQGCGAFLNGVPMQVAKARDFASCFLVTGFYYMRDAELQHEVERFARVAQKCQSIRRDGSAALDLALVAAGVFDAFWEVGLQPWDVAAGSLLVQEAGGLVSNYDTGAPYHIEGMGVIAGSPTAAADIAKLL